MADFLLCRRCLPVMATPPIGESTLAKLKQGSLLWFYGFKEACCVHRVAIFCYRSKSLLIRTSQCFLFNGFIFLGRYNDIAKHGFIAMGKHKPSTARMAAEKEASIVQIPGSDKSAGLEGIMIGIGEQVYSVLLLSFFFLEVFATGFIPYAGKALNFLLLSWMYKWNLSGVTLDRRLDFFESNWAFFAGFGSPCVLAIFFFPPLESYAVMATLFPLFVLTATGSDADNLVSSLRKQWLGVGLGRVPIFCGADTVSMKVLSFLPLRSREQNQGKKAL
uniref:Uncharacterized protein n=1 Tax=Chenopodium quinoa TaxID=63459 RepID=A0A803LJR6_CHEQI